MAPKNQKVVPTNKPPKSAAPKSTTQKALIKEALDMPHEVTPAAAPAPIHTPEENEIQVFSAPPRKKFPKILIILLILLLVGGGAYAAYEFIYWSPENAIKRTIVKATEAEIYKLSSKSTFDYKDDDSGLGVNGSLSASGKVNVKDPKNLIFDGNVVGEGSYETSGSKISVTLDADAKTLTDKIYFRVNKFPDFFLSFKEVLGKWVKLTKEELEQRGFDDKCQPTEAQLNAIENAIQNTDLFKDEKRGGVERLEGYPVRRYSAKLDNEALVTLMKDVMNQLPDGDDCGYKLSAEEEQELRKFLNEKLTSLTIDLWTGFDISSMRITAVMKLEDKQTLTVVSTTTQSDFGKEFTVEEPKDTLTFDEFLKKIGLGTVIEDFTFVSDTERESQQDDL